MDLPMAELIRLAKMAGVMNEADALTLSEAPDDYID